MEEKIDQDAMDMLDKGYDQVVRDEGPHDFYCQIPNLADDFGLSPYAYRLYGHLRRVAGESGKCWQNTQTLAAACGMSAGSVSNAKKELAETELIPFIRIEKVPTATGFSYDEITLTDLWKLNHDVYCKDTVHQVNGSPHEQIVHQVKQRITLLKKNNKTTTTRGSNPKNIFELYEENIGILSPLIADAIKDAESAYPYEWIRDAIRLAVENNKRNWKYCEAILRRWEIEGKDDGKKPSRANGNRNKQNPVNHQPELDPGELERKRAEIKAQFKAQGLIP